MARTKASHMARKFENVEDSSGSSEESSGQDVDMVEVNEEKEEHEQQEMEAGETGRKRFVAVCLRIINFLGYFYPAGKGRVRRKKRTRMGGGKDPRWLPPTKIYLTA